MNQNTSKTKFNFHLDLLITIAMLVVTFSGIALLQDTTYLVISHHGWGIVHRISSLILLVGVIRHLGNHIEWIQTVMGRLFGKLPVSVRTNFALDTLLLLAFIIIVATGLNMFPSSAAESGWATLHSGAGFTMVLIVVFHLVQHRKWIVRAFRLYTAPGNRPPHPTASTPEFIPPASETHSR